MSVAQVRNPNQKALSILHQPQPRKAISLEILKKINLPPFQQKERYFTQVFKGTTYFFTYQVLPQQFYH